MQKNIIKVPSLPRLEEKKKVAAYARVSSGKDAMLHSLSAQVSHYSNLIQNHNGWLYVGVYADESTTGTKENRENFQRMLADCRNGLIDMVLTKSISRFARNTVTLLQTVRELKVIGVDIYFEEQNIHTMSGDGELMLSILASYAQEESRSASENQKWRVKRNFEQGKPWCSVMLGYRYCDDKYIIVPEEAEVVKRIFEYYLSGLGYNGIAKKLNEEGYPTYSSKPWYHSTITKILRNYTYTGNLILQKFYRENHITKRTLINNGELTRYHVTNTHEPIISIECFESVQKEMALRAVKYKGNNAKKQEYPFSSIMICDNCGKNYRRKTIKTGVVWICSTYNTYGKDACASKQIPENILKQTLTKALGLDEFNEQIFSKIIDSIQVCNNNILILKFKDGHDQTIKWKDRSRSESWTAEMRQEAKEKMLERGIS